jgi:hypothetical protein
MIFFIGVTKVDFYHMSFMFFIIIYALRPACFRRYYFILLLYVDFYVFKKYVFSILINYVNPFGGYVAIANMLGLTGDKASDEDKYFRYNPNI